jgi:hypothetical protein
MIGRVTLCGVVEAANHQSPLQCSNQLQATPFREVHEKRGFGKLRPHTERTCRKADFRGSSETHRRERAQKAEFLGAEASL